MAGKRTDSMSFTRWNLKHTCKKRLIKRIKNLKNVKRKLLKSQDEVLSQSIAVVEDVRILAAPSEVAVVHDHDLDLAQDHRVPIRTNTRRHPKPLKDDRLHRLMLQCHLHLISNSVSTLRIKDINCCTKWAIRAVDWVWLILQFP